MMHSPVEVNNNSRFSDEKLFQFQDEFRQHVDRCEERFKDSDDQFKQLIEAQQKNTDAISSLIEETREVVQLHKDIQGATRVGKGLQTFLAWVIKWPLIGAGLYGIISWVIKNIPG
jgi:hypothetical protein